MFTGIVEEVGEVAQPGNRLRIKCRTVLEDARQGASIAVNGVCLTVVASDAGGFVCDLSPETLARTNLGALRENSPVNLERAAALGDRLSGHIVQGHVDGTAEFLSLEPLSDGNWWLRVRIPGDLTRYAIDKGSVTLDGVSLTIAALEDGVVAVAVIPHTYANTIIKSYTPGCRINLEVDLMTKIPVVIGHSRSHPLRSEHGPSRSEPGGSSDRARLLCGGLLQPPCYGCCSVVRNPHLSKWGAKPDPIDVPAPMPCSLRENLPSRYEAHPANHMQARS